VNRCRRVKKDFRRGTQERRSTTVRGGGITKELKDATASTATTLKRRGKVGEGKKEICNRQRKKNKSPAGKSADDKKAWVKKKKKKTPKKKKKKKKKECPVLTGDVLE